MYNKIILRENLFLAFEKFKKGKKSRPEVSEFEANIEDNIFLLQSELINQTYRHQAYQMFTINDPKKRLIHKASVRDRVLHQAVFQVLEPVFEPTFIFDSYSSRRGKGHHLAVKKLTGYARNLSENYTRNCYAIKIDISKYFHSIDHQILIEIVKKKIACPETLNLVSIIIESFTICPGKGIPLGNVTSQLFANIYLNGLDHYIKERLRLKHYIRYCDDLIIVKNESNFNNELILVSNYLCTKLQLKVKSDNLKVRKLGWGFDYLGYIILPHHQILRLATKKRMFRKLTIIKKSLSKGLTTEGKFNQVLNSYCGLLSHCNGYKVKTKIMQNVIG